MERLQTGNWPYLAVEDTKIGPDSTKAQKVKPSDNSPDHIPEMELSSKLKRNYARCILSFYSIRSTAIGSTAAAFRAGR
jgi:hypothetical protein